MNLSDPHPHHTQTTYNPGISVQPSSNAPPRSPSLAQAYRALSFDTSSSAPSPKSPMKWDDSLSSLWGEPANDTHGRDAKPETHKTPSSNGIAELGLASAYSNFMGSFSGAKSARATGSSSPAASQHRRTGSGGSSFQGVAQAYDKFVSAASAKLSKLSDALNDDSPAHSNDRLLKSSSHSQRLPPTPFGQPPTEISTLANANHTSNSYRHSQPTPSFQPSLQHHQYLHAPTSYSSGPLPPLPHSPLASAARSSELPRQSPASPSSLQAPASLSKSRSQGLVLQSSKHISSASSMYERPCPWDSAAVPQHTTSMPLDAVGLAALASQGLWQTILDRLAVHQAEDQGEQLRCSSYKVLALVKLRNYTQAAVDLAAAEQLLQADTGNPANTSWRSSASCRQPGAHPSSGQPAPPFVLLYLRALLPLKVGRVQEGIDSLYGLMEHCRQQLQAAEQLQQQQEQHAQATWQRRHQLVASALVAEHMAAQQPLAALQLLDQLLLQAPEDPHVWSAAARVQLSMGDVAAATAIFKRVEQLVGPELVAAAAAAAAAAAGGGKEQQAMQQCMVHNLIVVSPPESPAAATAPAGDAWPLAAPAAADPNLQQLLHQNRAALLLATHEPAAAQAELSAWLRIDPQDPAAHSNAALARIALGQLEEAVSELEEALRRWPQSLLQEQLLCNLSSLYDLQAGPAAARLRLQLSAWVSRVMPHDFELSCITG